MRKRYLSISLVTGLLCVVAIIGYLLPEGQAGPPVRTLLDNKGGKVIFTHASHTNDLDQNCSLCHHFTSEHDHPPKCTACHVKKFDDAFKTTHQKEMDKGLCRSCHHAESTISRFSHADHINNYVPDDCQACHHDEDIEPEAKACSHCHEHPNQKGTPGLMKASHARCRDCHEDFFEEGSEGCKNCHARNPDKKVMNTPRACSTCHEEPVEELIPNATKAFHTQCQTCHEYQGSGPYGDDACYQCHMK